MKKSLQTFFAIIICFFYLLQYGCRNETPLEASYPTSDQYLFIEQFKYVYGELIEGDTVAIIQIDFPTYSFNENTGILNSGFINFKVNHDLKAIIGRGEGLGGMAGGGAATMLFGFYSIPAKQNNLILQVVEKNGSAAIEYMGTSLYLKKGEVWINKYDSVDVQEHAKIKLTITDEIKNFGFQYKSNIKTD
jgi:hypothetical protein